MWMLKKKLTSHTACLILYYDQIMHLNQEFNLSKGRTKRWTNNVIWKHCMLIRKSIISSSLNPVTCKYDVSHWEHSIFTENALQTSNILEITLKEYYSILHVWLTLMLCISLNINILWNPIIRKIIRTKINLGKLKREEIYIHF